MKKIYIVLSFVFVFVLAQCLVGQVHAQIYPPDCGPCPALYYGGEYYGEYYGQYGGEYYGQYGGEYYGEYPGQAGQDFYQAGYQYYGEYGSQYFGEYFGEYADEFAPGYGSQYSGQYASQYGGEGSYSSEYSGESYSGEYTGQYSSQYGTEVVTYTISGWVFVDTNSNGILNCNFSCNNGSGDEPGQSNVTVQISGRRNSTTTTLSSPLSSRGTYSFTNLPSGNYTVTVTLPSGYHLTSNNQNSSVRLGPDATVNFGINNTLSPTPTIVPSPTPTPTPIPPTPTTAPGASTITGKVFIDFPPPENGNGTYESSTDQLYKGAQVQLKNAFLQTIGSYTTLVDGTYKFYNVYPGTYRVQLTLPSGYHVSDSAVDNYKSITIQ